MAIFVGESTDWLYDGCMSEADGGPKPGIPGADLGWSLGVILRRWHEGIEAAVSELPHGLRGYQILAVVAAVEPPTQSSLARHLNIDKTVMPYVVDALVSGDLVQRRVDPGDRRLRRIVITRHGRAVLKRLQKRVAEAEDAVFAGVSSQDRAAMLSLTGRLAASIHSRRPDLDACLAVMDAIASPVTQ